MEGERRPKPRDLRRPPCRLQQRRGAAMRNNRMYRPNVVTRRAAAELTGAVTPYRGVSPNKTITTTTTTSTTTTTRLWRNVLAEYAVQAATVRSLHEGDHAGRRQHEQKQPRSSGGTFPDEYAAQAATTRSLHQRGHAVP